MKSKNAQMMLGEHTTEMIIAVFCVLFVIVLGTIIYNTISGNREIQKAKLSLDLIYSNIADLQEVGSVRTFTLQGPKDWYIIALPDKIFKPIGCEENKACICICKYGDIDKCNSQKYAVCRILNEKSFIYESLENIKLDAYSDIELNMVAEGKISIA